MVVTAEAPTFDEFADRWLELKHPDLERSGLEHYNWTLSHLRPYFGSRRLSEISVATLDGYRRWEAAQGRLAPQSINRMLDTIKLVLDQAHEYGLIDQNPMRVNPTKRKLKARPRQRLWLDNADHIRALLDAAGELDALSRRDRQHIARRAMLATFIFAGLHMGELLSLRWRDVDFGRPAILIRGDGARAIDLLPPLRRELSILKAARPARGLRAARRVDPDALVFPSSTGQPLSNNNVRTRILRPSIRRANTNLSAQGSELLPEGLRADDLRRTFASILVALGVDIGSVQDQMGLAAYISLDHTWRHAMRRAPAEKEKLRGLTYEGTEFDAP